MAEKTLDAITQDASDGRPIQIKVRGSGNPLGVGFYDSNGLLFCADPILLCRAICEASPANGRCQRLLAAMVKAGV